MSASDQTSTPYRLAESGNIRLKDFLASVSPALKLLQTSSCLLTDDLQLVMVILSAIKN